MNNILIITPEIGREKGGIQNWMYFLNKFLLMNFKNVDIYPYKEKSFFSKFISLAKSKIYFLATWKMAIFIFPIIILTNRKVFIFIHGTEILQLGLLEKLFYYLVSRRNTYFISNSNATANLFVNITNRKIDIVQYPFMEINNNQNTTNQNTTNQNNKYKFFTLSRLVKRKNIENVVKAFNILKKEGFNFIYNIAGGGEEFDNIKKLIEKYNLQDEIKLLGKISEEDKNNLYMQSDYYLLPSIYDVTNGDIEGYGIVFIEANSYGLPVLSGDTGGMIEAVKEYETGIYTTGTIDDIKDKIITLSTTKFDRNTIINHSNSHSYKNQTKFLEFIKNSI